MAHTELKRVSHYVWESNPNTTSEETLREETFLNGMGVKTDSDPVVLSKKQAKLYNLFLGLTPTRKKDTEEKN